MTFPRFNLTKLRPATRARISTVQALYTAAVAKTQWFKSDQYIVLTTRLDHLHFQTLAKRYPKINDLVKRAEDTFPVFGSLLQDIYFALYLPKVDFRNPSELAPAYQLNADLIERVIRLELFVFTRDHARLNEGKSWIGMVQIAEQVLDGLPEELKEELRDQVRRQAATEQERTELDELIAQLEALLAEPPPEDDTADDLPTPPPPSNPPADETEDDQAPPAGEQPPVGEEPTPDAQGEGDDPGQGSEGDQDEETDDEASANAPGSDPNAGVGTQSEGDQSDDNRNDGQETADGPSQSSSTGQDDSSDSESESGGDLSDATEQAINDLLDALEAQAHEILDMQEPSEETDDERGERVDRLLRKALKDANGTLDNLAELLSSWGISPGEWKALKLEDQFQLADALTKMPNMTEFIKELGRMRHEALNALNQPGALDRQELVGIKIGGDLDNLNDAEFVMLTDPDLEIFLYANILEEQALENEFSGRAPSSEGDFIILADVSDSMVGPGERWLKAFILSALEIAKRKQRNVVIVFFDTIVQHIMVIPGGHATPLQKLTIATGFAGGGTNWQPPLEIAIANIADAGGPWHKADIVLVTDGQYVLPKAFVELYRTQATALSVRTTAVLIDIGYFSRGSLESFCDQVYSIKSLAGPEAAIPIFQTLALKAA